MQTENPIFDRTGTGHFNAFRYDIPKTLSSGEAKELHRAAGESRISAAAQRREALIADLENRQATIGAGDPNEMLRGIKDRGFSWRDVARLLNVSIAAVQKWRRGDVMSGANRFKMAKVVALLEVLEDGFIIEPVSWLEMPLKEGVDLSGMDLLLAGRYDLVLEFADDSFHDASSRVPVENILDEFDPDWRATRVDQVFESVRAGDGSISIQVRG